MGDTFQYHSLNTLKILKNDGRFDRSGLQIQKIEGGRPAFQNRPTAVEPKEFYMY
jgi:hypothetical protein